MDDVEVGSQKLVRMRCNSNFRIRRGIVVWTSIQKTVWNNLFISEKVLS
jgi:hypothetical protein